jgi:exopolysaccharide biosynthesis operon protein EpsL
MNQQHGRRTVMGAGASILALVNMLGSQAIAAQPGDVFIPYLEYSGNYSDNLLKLQNAGTARSRFGDDQLSDTYTTALGGLRFDQTWGRQHITADVSANRSQFDHFDAFDYTGKNGKANWNWVIGNHLQGNLAATYEKALAPFDDYIVLTPNIRTQRTSSGDLAWLIHPAWRLRSAYARNDVNYSAIALATSNMRSDSAELGLRYLARSGSNIGLVFRNVRGTYANMGTIGDALFNNNYVQKEVKVSVDWLVTGKSRLQFLGGPVQRKRTYFSSRDYSGFNARLSATTQPTGKLSLYGSLWRELGALDDLTANYALTDGVLFAPSLAISSKWKLEGTTTYQRRNYSGAEIIEGLTPSNRRDTYQRTALGLTYKAGPALSISTSLNREVRDSNLEVFNYRANGVALKVRYEY